MRVIIVRDRLSSGGGVVNYYQSIAPHLSVKHWFCDVGRPHGFYGGGVSWLLRLGWLRLVYDWFGLAWMILRFRPEVVHLNPGMDVVEMRSLPRDAVNLWIAHLLGRKVLVFWRGWENWWCGNPEFPGGNAGWLSRTYRLADRHIVLASRFRDDLRRWGFTAPVDLETTTVADDILEQAELDERADANLAGDGMNDEKPSPVTVRLLFLSRVEVAKGVFELLEAVRRLSQEGRRLPDLHLTVAGDGPGLAALRVRAEELNLTKSVEFTGFVSGTQKLDCYRQATIFCFLSYTEGMPNAVLEAMAMGLPLISSDAGGLRDILRDEETGLIIPYLADAPGKERFDPDAVAAAIERLARDPDLRRRMGGHNRQLARERFAAPKVAARLEEIYGKCGTRNAECGTGNGERGTENGEMGNGE